LCMVNSLQSFFILFISLLLLCMEGMKMKSWGKSRMVSV
jgi:hypothetical protein